MQEIRAELVRLRRLGRWMLLLQRVAVVLAWTIGILGVAVLVDFVIRMPGFLRTVLLLGGIAGIGTACVTYLAPAFRFLPDLTTLALRVERAVPTLRGRLASSVEFAESGVATDNPLAARAVAEAERRATAHPMSTVVDWRRTRRDLGVFGVVVAAALVLVVVNPAMARTGLTRLLLPLSGAEWPARTGVDSLMDDGAVHPRGIPLPLRAQATLGDIEDMRVTATYRVTRDGDAEPWRAIVLTHQAEGVYERLIDTDAEAIEFSFSTDDAGTERQRIELVDPPAVRRATLTAVPPAYASSRADESWEMGTGTDQRSASVPPLPEGSTLELELTLNKPLPIPEQPDERDRWIRRTLGWTVESVLPTLVVDESDPGRWTVSWRLDESVDLLMNLVDRHGIGNTDEIGFRILAAPDREPSVSIIEPQSDDVVLPTAVVPVVVEARDDLGVGRVALEISRMTESDAASGAAPTLLDERDREGEAPTERLETMLALEDFEVVPGHLVLLQAVASDEFELDGRRHEVARSPVRRLRVISENDLIEQIRRQMAVIRQNAIRIDSQQGELEASVGEVGPQAGVGRRQSQISERLTQQQDALESIADRQRRNGLDDEELTALLEATADHLGRAGQASNRAAEELERRLGEMATDGEDPGDRGEGGATQGGERAGGERASGEQAGGEQAGGEQAGGERAEGDGAEGERNDGAPSGAEPGDGDAESPGDGDASDGESTSSGAPEGAGGDAGEESRDEQANSRDDEGEADSRENDRAALEAQREVREELADLIGLLDRDEDAWVVTRRLERLREQLEEAQAETEQLAGQTVGREVDDLNEAELSELEKIAARQRDAADEAAALLEDMRRRAEGLETMDPDRAGVMRSAARTGEQRQLERDLRNAAEQTGGNRLQNAQASQQSAQATVQEMMDDIKESRRARARELQRQLASLVESIRRLVTIQEDELIALAQAAEPAEFDDRSRAMIRLSQNTDGVADEARRAGREADRIARVLGRAADAQGAAIQELRADPMRADRARDNEERSLELLNEALGLAEEMQQQLEEEEARRQRDELIGKYRELAEKQVALRQETEDLAAGPGGRRQLLDARRIGLVQQQVRGSLRELEQTFEAIEQSRLFSLTHRRMTDWSSAAEDALQEGDVGSSVIRAQNRIADSLVRLAEALEEEQADPNRFEQNQGGGGGAGGAGGGQPPLIPPVAELKALRGLQEQIYDETRALDAADDLADETRDAALQSLADEQQELYDLAFQMLEELARQGGGQGGGRANDNGQGGPAPDGGDEGMPIPPAPEWPSARSTIQEGRP